MKSLKKNLLLVVAILLLTPTLQAQDSLFIYKDKKIISKYAVNKIDSITFSRTETVAKPIITSFSFEKDNNDMLFENKNGEIDGTDIEVKLPFTTTLFIANFETDERNIVTVNGRRQQSGVTVNDFSSSVVYKVTTPKGESEEYKIKVKWKKGLPNISINTADGVPITSKEEYLRAYLVVDGMGMYDNFIDSIKIRGRGNSTWGYPKKPYKIKLDSKESILGLKKEKKWVLLANYIDPTHLLNMVAFKAGQLLDMPYTNHGIAVNVTVNGQYMGIYTFTEQVEVKKNRVNVDKKKGVLLEFDKYFDEDFKFKSTYFNLPVMVKDPDIEDEKPEDQDKLFNQIKEDFTKLEESLVSPNFPNNNYKELIDVESVIKYLIVYSITDNRELNHPKSTYMYKDKKGKYFMGPIWDFDWAYGYEGNYKHFANYNVPLLRNLGSSYTGTPFFKRILEGDPANKKLYKQMWMKFKVKKLPEIIKYINTMVENIEESQPKDYAVWRKGTRNYPNKINQFKQWLINRADFIDSEVSSW